MGNLTSPKRTEASVAKLGASNDPSAHGNVRKGPPVASHRITRTVSETEPPDHLSDEVKAMWTEWVTTAEWLSPSDLPALRYLCDLIERRNEMRDNPSKPHAAFGQLEGLIARFMGSMGLTPQARIQLGLAVVEAESKLELFLAGGTATGTDD